MALKSKKPVTKEEVEHENIVHYDRRFYVSVISILVTIFISIYTANKAWESGQRDRDKDMLIRAMDRIDSQLAEEVREKLALSKLISDSMTELREYIERIAMLCSSYQNKKISEYEFKELLKKYEEIRFQKRFLVIRNSSNLLPIFGQNVRDKMYNFIHWDEQITEQCTPKSMDYQQWLIRQREATAEITSQIVTLQERRQPQELRRKAELTIQLLN